MSRAQLLRLGYSARSIEHRLKAGRLHPTWPGVYAVGRPQVTLHGRWMAAVLACGTKAALSHESAGQLWKIRPFRPATVEVSIPAAGRRRPRGIVVHRQLNLEVRRREGIPVTAPICTLIALAARLDREPLEAAINEADKLDLIDPERLRRALDETPRRPGIGRLRRVLDERTFTFTRSELERRFLRIARKAGLPKPDSEQPVNGFEVDFFWPELGLVVETDGLRYHRTPAQQAADRLRDQAHTAAGLTPLRFTRAQVRFDPDYVGSTLATVAERLRRG